jgi:hypothetical protein
MAIWPANVADDGRLLIVVADVHCEQGDSLKKERHNL